MSQRIIEKILKLFEETIKNYRKCHIAITLLHIHCEYFSSSNKQIMDHMQMVKTPEARRKKLQMILLWMICLIMYNDVLQNKHFLVKILKNDITIQSNVISEP